MRVDGSAAWLLHSLPNVTDDYATLLLQISHRGTQLAWSQRYKTAQPGDPVSSGGLYQIMLADFVVSSAGVPSLNNVQSFVVNNTIGFYEISDWTPGDGEL